jgi:hypothetical protein
VIKKPKLGPPFKDPKEVKVMISMRVPKWLKAWLAANGGQSARTEEALTAYNNIGPEEIEYYKKVGELGRLERKRRPRS